jgi:hypothetical protein
MLHLPHLCCFSLDVGCHNRLPSLPTVTKRVQVGWTQCTHAAATGTHKRYIFVGQKRHAYMSGKTFRVIS